MLIDIVDVSFDLDMPCYFSLVGVQVRDSNCSFSRSSNRNMTTSET